MQGVDEPRGSSSFENSASPGVSSKPRAPSHSGPCCERCSSRVGSRPRAPDPRRRHRAKGARLQGLSSRHRTAAGTARYRRGATTRLDCGRDHQSGRDRRPCVPHRGSPRDTLDPRSVRPGSSPRPWGRLLCPHLRLEGAGTTPTVLGLVRTDLCRRACLDSVAARGSRRSGPAARGVDHCCALVGAAGGPGRVDGPTGDRLRPGARPRPLALARDHHCGVRTGTQSPIVVGRLSRDPLPHRLVRRRAHRRRGLRTRAPLSAARAEPHTGLPGCGRRGWRGLPPASQSVRLARAVPQFGLGGHAFPRAALSGRHRRFSLSFLALAMVSATRSLG